MEDVGEETAEYRGWWAVKLWYLSEERSNHKTLYENKTEIESENK